jgi:hypothetical protein
MSHINFMLVSLASLRLPIVSPMCDASACKKRLPGLDALRGSETLFGPPESSALDLGKQRLRGGKQEKRKKPLIINETS